MGRLIRNAALGAILSLLCVAPALADGALSGFLPGAGLVDVKVVTLADQKFLDIIRQHTDYSCGAAAVATVLRYAFGFGDITEYGVIGGMLKNSDPQRVRTRGFSMLDIKRYVEWLGMQGTGYRITMNTLFRVKVPSIVLLTVDGYEHFVVLKKATPDYVYVADPALGNRAIPTPEFASMWDRNTIFVISAPIYDTHNPLLAVRGPATMDRLAQGIPSDAAVLTNATLMLLQIPGPNRI